MNSSTVCCQVLCCLTGQEWGALGHCSSAVFGFKHASLGFWFCLFVCLDYFLFWVLFCFVAFFQTGFHCVALAVLELAL